MRRRGQRSYDPEAYKYLTVFNDPFSNKSLTPRIPDGKTTTSIGHKYHFRQTFTLGQTGAQQYDCNIIAYPGLSSPGAVLYGTDPAAISQKWYTFVNDLAPRNSNQEQRENDAIFKYRVVGVGLHVTLLSNSDANDGWWEAVRIPTSSHLNEWNLIREPPDTPSVLVPTQRNFELPTTDILNLPSYTTGRLRDLHHVVFHINPEGNEHDFQEAKDRHVDFDGIAGVEETFRSDAEIPTTLYPVRTAPTTTEDRETIVQSMVDTGWDSILLRIHGRDAANGNTAASQILVHMVHNIEVVYDERATLAKFHQRLPKIKNFEDKSTNKSKQTAAGKPLKGGS